jgi:formate dehydrogenase major subunit
VLIKRTERQARHGSSHGSLATLASQNTNGLDRRSFLRRSGLAAGGLAALGALPLASVQKAKAGPPPAKDAAVTIRKSICTHCAVGGFQRGLDRPGAELGIADQSRLALRQGRLGARAGDG